MNSGRYEEALRLRHDAEALVRMAEEALAAQRDPTLRDVAESELRSCLDLQDATLEAIGPTIEQRELEVRKAALAALAALRGDFGSDWTMKHRRWHSIPVKARLAGAIGAKAYLNGDW
jgi:hypothetical protein